MSNLIRGEFYKLRKSKYFIGMILLAIVTSFFLIIQWDNDAQIWQTSHPDIVNGLYSVSYAFQFIAVTSFIFALLGGGFISKDFETSNISKSFSYGYKRSKAILSKLIVFIIFSLLLELIYTSILVAYVSMNHGFCEDLNLSTILYLTRVIAIGIMYNVAIMCIIAMIAIITKSIFCTFALPFIFLISSSMADIHIGSYLFSYMPYIVGLRAMGIFSSKAEIIRSISSSVVIFIITIGASVLYVGNEDIK